MTAALAQAAAAAAVAPRAPRRLQRRAASFAGGWHAAARRPAAQHRPRASAGGDDQVQQPGQPPAGGEEQQAGGAALGPRDDDVLPDSLTGALEDASRATVEALERGVDRCVVSRQDTSGLAWAARLGGPTGQFLLGGPCPLGLACAAGIGPGHRHCRWPCRKVARAQLISSPLAICLPG